MGIPRNPLLVPPADTDPDDLLGRSMSSADLIRGLRRINPALTVPAPCDDNRTPRFKGITTLWIGPPFAPGSTKICALHLGAIPEWSQLDPQGVLITRGWRAIFEKVVRTGAATQEQIERVFRISATRGVSDTLCGWCVREGRRVPHNHGRLKMCDLHEGAYAAARRAHYQQPENESRARWRKTKDIVALAPQGGTS